MALTVMQTLRLLDPLGGSWFHSTMFPKTSLKFNAALFFTFGTLKHLYLHPTIFETNIIAILNVSRTLRDYHSTFFALMLRCYQDLFASLFEYTLNFFTQR